MSHAPFPALLVRQDDNGHVTAAVEQLSPDQLPAGQVTIEVRFSSVNYKDALAIEGHPGVVRAFPHVPGIDAAGVIVDSQHVRFAPGDEVLITGYGFGDRMWGGYSRFVRVPADIIVPRPAGLSLEACMLYGTAGFTAGLAMAAIEQHGIAPAQGEVVVTGASGGVGSIAVAILAKLGYRVFAVSGKRESHALLRGLGAAGILSRENVVDSSERPLLTGRWAAAVDTVGGATLATILRSTAPHGCVTACGLVGGERLELSVHPFILRGVTLAGIDSAHCPMPQRLSVWEKLAGPWRPVRLEELKTEIALDQVCDYSSRIKAGKVTGRTVVRL